MYAYVHIQCSVVYVRLVVHVWHGASEGCSYTMHKLCMSKVEVKSFTRTGMPYRIHKDETMLA